MNKEKLLQLFKKTNGASYKKLSELTGIPKSTLHSLSSKFNIDKNQFKFNHNFFSSINNESTAYWLGFLMADGCVCAPSHSHKKPFLTVLLGIKDKCHLEKLMNAFNSKNKIHFYTDKHNIKTCSIRLYSHILCNDLQKLGCHPNKSLNLQFPTIPNFLQHHFIRGYIDGDGCICYRKNGNRRNLSINITGTLQFLTKTQSIFNEQLDISFKKLQNAGRNKSLTINGNKQSIKILQWIYYNSNICLERKYNIYINNI